MKSWFLFFMLPLTIFSQDSTIVHKELKASLTSEKIKVDGLANESSWQNAEIATDFFQTTEGEVGAPATEKTEVKVLYSNLGVYFYVKNLTQDVSTFKKELTQRDNFGNVDWFALKIDSYQSEQGAQIFGVTSVGVQYDAIGAKFYEDGNWDAVWKSATSFDDEGWNLEIFLPYSALRFPSKPIQEWNIQFFRSIRAKRETVVWNYLNPEISNQFTQFGVLKGINNISPPVRLSITPFLATTITNNGFNKDFFSNRAISGGLDLKYGLNDAFTLDMTIIPDFSQARSDEQILNLGPFEVQFDENRSFFTEGVELFDKGDVFYSRRIGGRHFYRNDVPDIDDETVLEISQSSKPQIINSTKISGRTNGGLGIGFLNSVENRSYANIKYEDGREEEFLLNPLTNYNIIVADQNFKNSSSVSLTNTNVWREGNAYDANVTSLTFDLKNKKQSYSIDGEGQFSQQIYENSDNNNGHSFGLDLNKTSGKLTGNVGYSEESDTYNPNDFGFLYNNNSRNVHFEAHFYEYKPKRLRQYRVNFWGNYNRLYKPNVFTSINLGSSLFFSTKKIFNFGVWGNYNLVPSFDYNEPRAEGRYFVEQNRWILGPWISTDYRKPLTLDLNFRLGGNQGTERYFYGVNGGSRFRVSDKFKIEFRTNYQANVSNVGYVSAQEESSGFDDLGVDDVVFGVRDRTTITNNLTLSYTFNNKMSLTFDTRHYWSKLNYKDFKLLNLEGYLNEISYTGFNEDQENLHDSSFNFFTVDFVYKWRFAPGSDLFFIWKTNITNSADAKEKYFEALSQTLKEENTNVFTLKALYYLDYNAINLKRKARRMK